MTDTFKINSINSSRSRRRLHRRSAIEQRLKRRPSLSRLVAPDDDADADADADDDVDNSAESISISQTAAAAIRERKI